MLGASTSASHVFLEAERHGEFKGVVAIGEILRADPTMRLSQLECIRIEPVSNRASLSSIAFDGRWDELIHLPVVGRRGNFLGGLARRAVRQAIHEYHPATGDRGSSWLRELVAAYGVTTAGLVRTVSKSVNIAGDNAGVRGNE